MALTKNDIRKIEEILDRTLNDHFKLLLTKDEFYKKTDEIMRELKAIREITSLEKICPATP